MDLKWYFKFDLFDTEIDEIEILKQMKMKMGIFSKNHDSDWPNQQVEWNSSKIHHDLPEIKKKLIIISPCSLMKLSVSALKTGVVGDLQTQNPKHAPQRSISQSAVD